jgi:hypothetical protein
MVLIGLVGPKQVGKDTCADYLVKKHGFQKKAFATRLKRICQDLFHLSEDQLHDQTIKETIDPRWGVSPRQLFQQVGTECFRVHLPRQLPALQNHESIWVRSLRMEIMDELKSNPNVDIVVSDVRFMDEAAMIKGLGGILIRIESQDPSKSDKKDDHASEQSQRNILTDLTLLNPMDERFYEHIQATLTKYL